MNIAQADAYLASLTPAVGAFEVTYTQVTQSSQWDRGFNAHGKAFVASLSRSGKVLTEEMPGGFALPLSGGAGWNEEQARIRLAQSLQNVYG